MVKTIQLANGETMAYRKRSGGGHPLVLVHGNMTSSKHWDILMDALVNHPILSQSLLLKILVMMSNYLWMHCNCKALI